MKIKIFAIVALIAGAGLTYGGYIEKSNLDELSASGVITKGVPVGGKASRTRSNFLKVEFLPRGRTKPMTKSFEVTESFIDGITSGKQITTDSVRVRYLPRDPRIAMIVGGSRHWTVFLWVGPVVCLLGVAILIYSLRKKKAPLPEPQA